MVNNPIDLWWISFVFPSRAIFVTLFICFHRIFILFYVFHLPSHPFKRFGVRDWSRGRDRRRDTRLTKRPGTTTPARGGLKEENSTRWRKIQKKREKKSHASKVNSVAFNLEIEEEEK
jgi:hypothetical protein